MSRVVPNIRELPVICHDAGNSTWHYSSDDDTYYRLYPSGEYSMIMRKYLPDANKLWDNRISRSPVKTKESIASSKPSEATFKLSEHALATEKKKI